MPIRQKRRINRNIYSDQISTILRLSISNECSESEMLRRIIDYYIRSKEKESNKVDKS